MRRLPQNLYLHNTPFRSSVRGSARELTNREIVGNAGHQETAPIVSDFERDQGIIAAYESEKARYLRTCTEEAEIKLRYAFAERREALTIDIANVREITQTQLREAAAAAALYATKLPHRVSRTGVRAPSLWERLVTLDAVMPFYRAAARTARALDASNVALRTSRDRLDALEREMRRAIYLREDAARRRLETPEGLALFHRDPAVRQAFEAKQAVERRRAADAERIRSGEVSPEDARDRDMAQRRQRFARVPMQGVMIAQIVRYGPLEYYVLRDLGNAEYLLAAHPAIEPLRDLVFDVTAVSDGIEAALRYSTTDLPMRVIDHLRATRSAAAAADEDQRHRLALRTDRPLRVTDTTGATEAAVSASLVLLANAVAEYGIPRTLAPVGDTAP